jgi:THO complex subunit 4
VSLVYDRQDRSTGVAYVSYAHLEDAIKALNDFNGQNAYDQPIYLTMLPSKDGSKDSSAAAAAASRRNPADPSKPSRSLFDRIENPSARRGRGRDQRSLSPEGPIRHSDVSKPPPEHIDRYVPGQRDNSRRRSPLRRGGPGGGRGSHGRRPGARREQGRRDDQGRQMVQGRPRKTQEELDAEMDDYWNQGDAPAPNQASNGNAGATKTAGAAGGDDDIDMIE